MQKVIGRAAQARRNAIRKAERLKALETQRDRSLYRKRKILYDREEFNAVREARYNRAEDYALGPLAPWRDNPAQQYVRGTLSMRRFKTPLLAEKDLEKAEDWFVREGDRVAVVKGRSAIVGRIGTVTEVQENVGRVVIKGLNITEKAIPGPLDDQGMKVMAIEEAIPLSDVRLVHMVHDPHTSIARDVIVNNKGLSRENERFDRFTGKLEWDRYIQPQNLHIPWPAKKKNEIFETVEGDTPVEALTETTFRHELRHRIMPASVIDELRGKYSKFRTRHDAAYIEKKLREDEQEERKTRWAELIVARAEGKQLVDPPEDTEDVTRSRTEGISPQQQLKEDAVLEHLGAVMAQQQATQQRGAQASIT